MRVKLIRLILLAINAYDGMPMPEEPLFAAVRMVSGPDKPTQADFSDALKEAEGKGYVAGASDDLSGRTWSLTTAGVHKARALR